MPAPQTKSPIAIDGQFGDWVLSERIDYSDVPGYGLYSQAQGGILYFAMMAPMAIGPNTTFWLNTDRNTATGYQVFGFAAGAEYNVNIKADGTAAIYSGGAGQTLVLDNIQIAYSADHKSIEFAVPLSAIGNPTATSVLFDVNDSTYAPSDYAAGRPYIAYSDDIVRTSATHKIGIVFSATTAAKYFSATAYSQLFMAVQSQAIQAGVGFDILTEADLTNVAKLANYDALVFPSFANVQASQVTAITDALLRVSNQFGVGLITAGNFMTNDETGAALPGDSYARMKLLFDATRVTGGFPADVSITATDANGTVIKTAAAGTVVHDYKGVAWDAFASVSGTGQVVATETVAGQSYAAVLATHTGGKNVLFSTPGVMADNNLLWQAIDYAANAPGVSIGLEISRNKAIVASRTDMDQAMERDDVSPGAGMQGIYDKLLPILAQWKQQYSFVGSYYVDIGNNAAEAQTTDWSVSAPYYAQLLALGNELGSHSVTHPEDTNILTAAQIQAEFQGSKAIIEEKMSAYLGRTFTVQGAAVPGAGENLATALAISQYYSYITGGYSSVGAGYPGAFGYLTPDATNSVYLAPNTSFDFTLADFQKLGAAGASAAWAAEWSQLTANAALPIVVWPWHDYGPTLWQTDAPNTSPYSLQMFTDWIARAYQSGAEFVTEADLAARIKSFDGSGVTYSVSGSTVNVAVTSAHAGTFALNVSGAGGQVIKNAGSWYAYDDDQVFLSATGGSYTITLGASQDRVTHIAALPMRGDLLSVSGNGTDLSFSMVGDGDVTIALGAIGSLVPVLTGTGATIASRTGDTLVVRLTGLGQHDVSLRMLAAPTTAVATLAFSADSGASATDLVTNVAAQIVSGTLSAPLAAGEVVQVSLDNGVTWRNATGVTGTTFTLAGVTLTGSSTLVGRVTNGNGLSSAGLSRAYVLDTAAPLEVVAITAMTLDSGVASDFVTNNGAAGRTVTGTLSTALGTGETLRVSTNGGATWLTPTVSGTSWSVVDPLAHTTSWGITAQVIDLAGNLGALASRSATLDTSVPVAPGAPDLIAASDSGVSSTDNLTKVIRPTFTGTATAGTTVSLYDGTALVGTAQASSSGSWSINATTLADGVHAITARASNLAGTSSAASAALSVTIDTVAAAPVLTGGSTSLLSLGMTGTGEAGATVSIMEGTTSIGTTSVGVNGTWSWQFLPGLTTRTLTTVQTDKAGNTSAASGLAIFGTSLSTTLSGAAGNDLLVGRSGRDTFAFSGSFGNDVVADFTATGLIHDMISFQASSKLNSYAAVMSRTTQVGANAVISLDSSNSVTLLNVSKSNLSASDFKFV